MKKIKRILVLSSIFAAIASTNVYAAQPFEDVSSERWYAESVSYCYENNLMNGVTDKLFEPERSITRAEFATVLYRLAGTPQFKDAHSFEDVVADSYYNDAVSWCYENGIVNGMNDTVFAPKEKIIRQDIACMLERYVNKMDHDFTEGRLVAELSFVDVDEVSGYAKDSVMFTAKYSFMVGNADGKFQPKAEASRAEVSTVLMRLDKMVSGEDYIYDNFLYMNKKHSDEGILNNLAIEGESVEIPVGYLRNGLSAVKEWKGTVLCECIGDYELILDGIRYLIDIDDVNHQIKYGYVDGDIVGAIESDNLELVTALYSLVEYAASPDNTIDKELCEAFLTYTQNDSGSYEDHDSELDKLLVYDYYGKYNGWHIVQMGFVDWVVTGDIAEVMIGGHKFTFGSGCYPPYFLAYKDGQMLLVKKAFEQGFLTNEDIYALGLVRGDIS